MHLNSEDFRGMETVEMKNICLVFADEICATCKTSETLRDAYHAMLAAATQLLARAEELRTRELIERKEEWETQQRWNLIEGKIKKPVKFFSMKEIGDLLG